MKRIPLICTSALLALALAGCGGTQTAGQAEYIGLDAAKAVALEDAGVQETSAVFSTAGLDKRNGIDYYDVEFTANGQEYEYDIDAVTGVVIEHSVDGQDANTTLSAAPASPSPSPSATPQTSGTTTATQLPAQTQATPKSQTTGQSTSITADQAKEKALAHAGLTSSQVTFVKAKLDWDDGRQVYEVEFYDGNYKEYDYEIDAATGTVVKYDYDAEYSIPNQSSGGQSSQSSQGITADQAKEKALSQVPGATTSDIYGFKADYDDGRIQYEGKIIYNGMEYEFEIDGYSGSIREWESEPVGH